MSNDFGQDWADELTEYFTSGTDITPPPTTVYVTLYDDTGTELNGDLQNGRVAVSIGSGWTKNGTAFENASEINFGENTSGSTITVQEVALKDQDADDATALEYFRADIGSAPQDYADQTRVFYNAGGISFDILD